MKTRTHESFAFLEARLERFGETLGTSDSPLQTDGGWTGAFEIRLPVFEGGVPKLPEEPTSTQIGRVELRCERVDGCSSLSVERTLVHSMKLRHHHRATIRCAADRLSSLASWSQEFSIEGSQLPLESKESTTLAQWRARTGADEGVALTSTWTLMDALQRWSAQDPVPEQRFDLLDDLELWFPDQRLTRVPPTTLAIGGRAVELLGYRQLGRGLTPRFYWLTPKGRLLFVLDSLWALVPEETR